MRGSVSRVSTALSRLRLHLLRSKSPIHQNPSHCKLVMGASASGEIRAELDKLFRASAAADAAVMQQMMSCVLVPCVTNESDCVTCKCVCVRLVICICDCGSEFCMSLVQCITFCASEVAIAAFDSVCLLFLFRGLPRLFY